jgi:predicted small lipoprotein YifL
VTRFFDRPYLRLALMAALAASLGLSACGRKGPLDPPPGASLAGEPQPSMPGLMSTPATPIGGQAKDGEAGIGADGRPVAAKGTKKQIPLDVLLN